MLELRHVIYNRSSIRNRQNQYSFNCKFPSNKTIGISGPSGIGKSTLLALIGGYLSPNSGDILWSASSILQKEIWDRPITSLFQDGNLFPHLTGIQNLTITQPNLTTEDIKTNKWIGRLNIFDCLDRYPHELSGGQQQRISLARIFLRSQPLLLLDEPFSALDERIKTDVIASLLDYIQHIQGQIIIATHSKDELSALSASEYEIRDCSKHIEIAQI